MSSNPSDPRRDAPPRSPGSSTMDPLIGRVVLGRYEIQQRIGSGGMGSVYVGKQQAIARSVALKVLRTDLMNNDHVRQRFKREAEIIAKLKHPNTIQLYDYGETEDGLAVMVMELLVGQSLSERLKTDGPLTLDKTLEVADEVCSSLGEAHLLGLVHRDLKPANIFLAEVGNQIHAKVLDFGIARLLDEESTRLTSTGQVFGTPRYMSPEQAMSTADVDARSDLYSLGLIIYECLVGQPPFVAQTSIQYLSAHSTQAPPKLREHFPAAPVELEALIDRCLEKDPEARPQTADEVGNIVGQIRTALKATTTPPLAPPPPKKDPGTAGSVTVPTKVATQKPPPPVTGEKPGRPVAKPPPPGPSPGVVIGLAGAAVLILGIGAWIFFRDTPAPLLSGEPDASMHVALIDEPDAAAIEVARDEPDAQALEADARPRDEPVPDSGAEPVDSDTKAKPRRRDAGVRAPPPGDGVITGPRNFFIEGTDDAMDVEKLARACKTSVWSGMSRLTTKACADGCAILVDDQCAGLTPAEDRPISPGKRKVVIVCDGKVRKTSSVRFKEDAVAQVACK